jgi:hypothetical protein
LSKSGLWPGFLQTARINISNQMADSSYPAITDYYQVPIHTIAINALLSSA